MLCWNSDTGGFQQVLGMGAASTKHKDGGDTYAPRLLDAPVTIKDQEKADREAMDFMWGTDKVCGSMEWCAPRIKHPDSRCGGVRSTTARVSIEHSEGVL